MADCCHDDCGIDPTQGRQARMLWAVLIINAVMFVVEFTAGWLAGSTALLGDSLDMLGDALVYGFSLFVVARGERWKAVSAAFKGGIMAVFGVIVLAEATGKLLWGTAPAYSIMATVGVAVLAANLVCLVLLTRHRGDDVNMRSAWVCSRNDIIANSGVLVAAAAVAASGSRWPDVVIGLAIAALFLRSAAGVLADARRSYQAASA
ncbi:cation transporter [Arhodomonas sp. SL1]|uniref:cation transporter n=1 Tax=Arhodomonas sp. SL1 TaxID=3425691 RepID=UPI003F882CEB